MPYLRIQTNQVIEDGRRGDLLQGASQLAADALGKPERYVMVAVEDGAAMTFAGTDAPLAYLELKSIGLDESGTAELSERLCRLVEEHLHVPRERVYVEFANAARHMWGWDGGVF